MPLFNPLESPPGHLSAGPCEPETSLIAPDAQLDPIARALSREAPVSVVLLLGPAGAGKTGRVAAALGPVRDRFDVIVGFQSRAGPMSLDDELRKLDLYLARQSPTYRDRCGREPLSAVHIEPNGELRGGARDERLRDNLIHTLRHECVLLVFDGFEANLDASRQDEALPCLDPAWDRLLEALAGRLSEAGSRVLLTSRARPVALSQGPRVHGIAVPWIDDAARHRSASIESASPEARRLLWVLGRAGEPVAERLLQGVWSGESFEDEMLRRIAAALAAMPKGMSAAVPPLPAEMRARLEALVDKPAPVAPDVGPLLEALDGAGLVRRQGQGEAAAYSIDRRVSELVSAWMSAHPDELAGRTETAVWQAYGERYATLFQGLSGSDEPAESADKAQPLSPQAAEAGLRAVWYLVRAGAWDALFRVLASGRLTKVADPLLFAELMGDLQSAANRMPPGEPRYSLRAYLADVLHEAAHKPRAFDLYAQAVEEAEALGHWAEVGRIAQNWAVALRGGGRPLVAALVFRRAGAALRKAEVPTLQAIGVELEGLRIQVHRSPAEETVADIQRHLSELRSWWQCSQAGENIAEAPDPRLLAQAYTTALHLATRADQALERWQDCLDRFAELDRVEREYGLSDYERARTRVNQCRPLLELGQTDEAQAVLEQCLKEFLGAGDEARQAAALSALSDLWDERGDLEQAFAIERQALGIRELMADPEARATSHQNLSTLLDKANRPQEAAAHRLAALVCRAVGGHDMGATIGSLSADIRRAKSRGERYELPRLVAVLEMAEFASLRRFLEGRDLEVESLQTAIDRLIEQIHVPAG